MSEKIISKDEMTTLALAMANARPFTEDEYFSVVKWAEGVRVDSMLLDMILNGKAYASWQDPDGITLHKK